MKDIKLVNIINENQIYEITIMPKDSTGHALMMGKRGGKFFFWDVNFRLAHHVTEFNCEHDMKDKFHHYINQNYPDLNHKQSARLVTPEMKKEIDKRKHRGDLGREASPTTTLSA